MRGFGARAGWQHAFTRLANRLAAPASSFAAQWPAELAQRIYDIWHACSCRLAQLTVRLAHLPAAAEFSRSFGARATWFQICQRIQQRCSGGLGTVNTSSVLPFGCFVQFDGVRASHPDVVEFGNATVADAGLTSEMRFSFD